MRFLVFLILFLSCFSANLFGIAPDSTILAEREFYLKKYKSVKDTMTVNTWLNLKRLSDNLQEVVARDQLIIDQLLGKTNRDSSDLDSVNAMENELRQLRFANSRLISRSENDLNMLWILKTSASILTIMVLVMIYLLITSNSRIARYKKRQSELESHKIGIQNQLLFQELEVSKLKQREQDFRSELEKGLITYQEKLSLLQKRNNLLEEEFSKIKNHGINPESGVFYLPLKSIDISEIPQDSEDFAIVLRAITDERDSLLNLAGKLQKQIHEEKEKYNKLVLMIKSLPDMNDGT